MASQVKHLREEISLILKIARAKDEVGHHFGKPRGICRPLWIGGQSAAKVEKPQHSSHRMCG